MVDPVTTTIAALITALFWPCWGYCKFIRSKNRP